MTGPGRVATLRRLPAALGLLVLVEVALRRMPLPRLCALLGVALRTDAPAPAAGPARLDADDLARCRAVRRLLSVWPGGRERGCLRFALVAGRLLDHVGPELQLGVARVHGRTVAHAWLTVDGAALDPTAGRYVPLAARSG